ncbi:hypothetical protein GVN16_01295 [Emticicia sp. CRIBPO]|jgi:hypothetical protein|uniref:hypothetical protein n=1 Tax=Emticicia sp. CRIBPO TaxID=2683258 RepID=UPI0014135FB3|nr:hypothetical protein [Emticicia sp. CRIBPO]NBA84375.1 hypothetical protein [Emticicia sp. CRIBPO]
MKLIDTLILFASLALLIMWVDQVVYKGVPLKDSYFFLMFSLAGFLYYVYRRGQRKIEENKEDDKKPKSGKKNK